MRYEIEYNHRLKQYLVINMDNKVTQSAWNKRLEALSCRNALNHSLVSGRKPAKLRLVK